MDNSPRSITAPIFLQSAEDLVSRIGCDPSPAALPLLREAEALVEVLKAWQTCRPTDDVRIAVIQQLFELNRRAMDHLLRSPQTRRTPELPEPEG